MTKIYPEEVVAEMFRTASQDVPLWHSTWTKWGELAQTLSQVTWHIRFRTDDHIYNALKY